jgi:hypothetical protein
MLSKPDEEHIESLLKKIRPYPSANFYARVESAPWTEPESTGKVRLRYPVLPRLKPAVITAGFLVILLAISGLFLMPSVRATAQNFLQFLMPAASDTITVPVKIPYPDVSVVFDPSASYSLNYEEAQEFVEYHLKQISIPDASLQFNGARYDRQLERVTIRYSAAKSDLYFSQRPAGAIAEYSKIGASAPVEIVDVRGAVGEYVRGGWKIFSPGNQVIQTAPAGEQILVDAIWDSSLPQSILRWEEDGFLYELLSVGDPQIERSDLISYAESVK